MQAPRGPMWAPTAHSTVWMSGVEYQEPGAGATAAWAIVTVASIMPAASATREPLFKRNEDIAFSFGLPSRGRGRTWSKRSRSKTTLRCSDTFTIRAASPRDRLGFYLSPRKERRSADFGKLEGGEAIGLASEPPQPEPTLSIFRRYRPSGDRARSASRLDAGAFLGAVNLREEDREAAP